MLWGSGEIEQRTRFGLWALTSAALFLGACSGGNERDTGETVARKVDALANPVTVTLQTPGAVPVLSPVVAVSNSLSLGAAAEIVRGTITAVGSSGGGLQTQPDALLNDTWSRGPVTLADRTKVRGTLHASHRTLGNSVQITTLDATPTFDPLSTLSWTVKYPSATTGANVALNAGQSRSLAPGQYGAVTLNSQATLTLHAGTYYLSSLDLESASTVQLDQTAGPVIIYADTNLILRGTFVSLTSAPPDLLVAYLGTSSFLVESLFNGAVIAPFTTFTLRAVSGIHTGYFYGKDFQILDAHTRVQYRAPLAIATAAAPSGFSCRQLVTALVPPAGLSAALARYCKACPTSDDTDQDSVPDCLDGCPYDATKTDPGVCGCGTPETDSDGDGTPNCIDRCPLDKNNTSPGECGCFGAPGLKPLGTVCNDTACPLPGGALTSTCDGAGVCGSRNACLPEPSPDCRFVDYQGESYWLCGLATPGGGANAGPAPGQLTQAAAAQACSAKGLTLLRVSSLTENRFLTHFLSAPIWLGANDLTSANNWRWTTPQTRDGDPFWSGSASGTTVGGRFAYWAQGAPGAQRCATMRPGDGHWVDTNCSETHGFVCGFAVPISTTGDGGTTIPGMLGQPRPLVNCKPESQSKLPGTLDELDADFVQAGHRNFIGAAANPPPDGSTCIDDNPDASAIGLNPQVGGGCSALNVQRLSHCTTNADCAGFGAGYLCREYKDSLDCNPPNSDASVTTETTADCVGHARCMQISCPPSVAPCDEIDICDPGTTFDAGLDPGSNLDAGAFNPATIFGGALPDAAPSGQYVDPPDGSGVEHTWCAMNPQAPIPDATQPAGNYNGESGKNTKLKFDFDPDLVFDVHPNPLALGESNTLMHAKASLAASVTMQGFLGQDFSASILDASIGISVDRCSVDDTHDTKFTVFGLDLIKPEDLGIPTIDTNDPSSKFFDATQTCSETLARFEVLADRSKKAFRDAQQLLFQYHQAKGHGLTLAADLCSQIGVIAANVPFFPGGNKCPLNEPVEFTINRFVTYYQDQVSELRDAASDLAGATNALKGKLFDPQQLNLQFADTSGEESQTIVNVPFAIGPVPMVLQVDVFAKYGVSGNFDLDLEFPLGLDTPVGPPQTIAHIGANVVPYAGAGLSAFVGAGFDLGAISATIGLEGQVTLADLKAPIFAGAGFDVAVTDDSARPLPVDLAPPVSLAANAFQFSVPKSFKFFVTYDYGAGVDLDNVLSGEIDGRLRIKFFFFSRTWRKRVVKFDGWSKHFNIVQGGSSMPVGSIGSSAGASRTVASDPSTARTTTQVAGGQAAAGLAEPQVPLMILAALPVPQPGDPIPDAGTGNSVGFDAGAVQSLFYDSQCCLKLGDVCQPHATRPACCPGMRCQGSDPSQIPDGGVNLDIGTCVTVCKNPTDDCKTDVDCCQTGARPILCASDRTCEQCVTTGGACLDNHDCCAADGTTCDPNTLHCTLPPQCVHTGNACVSDTDCCPQDGTTCDPGTKTCLQPVVVR